MRVWLLCLCMLLASCGSDPVGGNSSETGNCKIAGTLYGEDGRVASHRSVVLMASDADRFDSTAAPLVTLTDGAGRYAFAALDSGAWILTVVDGVSETGLLRRCSLASGDTLALFDTLGAVGTVRFNRRSLGDSLLVAVAGTPFGGVLPEGDSELILHNIPASPLLTITAERAGVTILTENCALAGGSELVVGEAPLLSGYLYDSTGRAMVDMPVQVVARSYRASQSVTAPAVARTDRDGRYHFSALPPGEWSLTAVDGAGELGLYKEITSTGSVLQFEDTVMPTGQLELSRIVANKRASIDLVGTPLGVVLDVGVAGSIMAGVPAGQPLRMVMTSEETAVLDTVIALQPSDTTHLSISPKVLFVCGDAETALTAATLVPQAALLGCQSAVVEAGAFDTSGIYGYDLLYLTGSAALHDTATVTLKNIHLPLINGVTALFEPLGLASLAGMDSSATGALTTAADHQILAYLTRPDIVQGAVLELTEGATGWATPSAAARVVVQQVDDATRAQLFTYNRSAAMTAGNAPMRRVGIFTENMALTPEGAELVTGALRWALKI